MNLEHYKEHYDFYDQISVAIIADSRDARRDGKRITTFLIQAPQTVLSHLVRHRVFSFSVSSKRALSAKRMSTSTNFMPKFRTAHVRGMQPAEFITDEGALEALEFHWWRAKEFIEDFLDSDYAYYNVAKEIMNQLTVPWQIINILVTATDFENFFNLRIHPDTQLETQVVAYKMRQLLQTNTPQYLTKDQWHIPFYTSDMAALDTWEKLAVSAARCARTSYQLPDKNINSTVESDLELCKKLLTFPFHASPFEHQAIPATMADLYPDIPKEYYSTIKSNYHANFTNWVQLRKLIEISEHNFEYLQDSRKVAEEFRREII